MFLTSAEKQKTTQGRFQGHSAARKRQRLLGSADNIPASVYCTSQYRCPVMAVRSEASASRLSPELLVNSADETLIDSYRPKMPVQSKRATKHRHHIQTAQTHNDPNSPIGSEIIGLELKTIYLHLPIPPIPGSIAERLQLPHHHPQGYRERVGFRSREARKDDSKVLSTLLNDLRAQERQSRVCAAIAIGEAAETRQPFTVLSVASLKALSFLIEYIGEMDNDYVYAVAPLLKNALTGCIQAHRQAAAVVVKHIALGVLLHLLNLLIPSLFEAYRPLRILAFGPPTERFYRNTYMAVNRAPSCHVTPLVLPVRMALARTTSPFSAIYLPAYNHLKRDYFRSAGCRIL